MLSNARCLAEGVEVPSHGVAFIDPRSSHVDIVQAVGRAIRLSPEKKTGTIILPVFLKSAANAVSEIEGSNFKPIWEVLDALKAHDDVLAWDLDQIRTEMGRTPGTSVSADDLGKLGISLPSTVDESFGNIPAPHTVFIGARKLLPGHSIHVDKSGVRVERWYDVVSASEQVKRRADPGKTLFELLDDAVRLRLIADVPVGAFLSGGVDNSIVSALAARHHKHLHTFSIGYADDPFFDESQYAEEVARHIKSEHSTFKLTREALAHDYTRLLSATDEPFADSSALPSFMLCERTRKQVTVAVSGDGADEVFGGYVGSSNLSFPTQFLKGLSLNESPFFVM